MSLIFSRQCEYALQAILYMSARPTSEYTNIIEISDRLGIPMPFLGKTLQLLVQQKILASQKGPKGGFRLAKPPGKISLYHIVEAIDGTDLFTSCVLGFPKCSSANPCPVHEEWSGLRENVYHMLVSRTITDISNEISSSKQLRLKLRLA